MVRQRHGLSCLACGENHHHIFARQKASGAYVDDTEEVESLSLRLIPQAQLPYLRSDPDCSINWVDTTPHPRLFAHTRLQRHCCSVHLFKR